MGALLDKIRELREALLGSRASILMLGFDAVGKTTILYRLKLNKLVSAIPTVGFNVETLDPVKNVSFTIWDIRGSERIRPLWRYYFTNTEGLVFVVDSVDQDSFCEIRDELDRVLGSEELAGVPLVVLANKQDLPNAHSPTDIATKLGLHNLKDRQWHIQGTSALTGSGLNEAMEQLADLVTEFQHNKYRRSS